MGAFVKDHHVAGLLNNLNMRFSHEDGVKEIAELHKEFGLFNKGRPLSRSLAALNSGPTHDWGERLGWHRYLEWLKRAPSDEAKVSGHDRINDALDKNLTSRRPATVHFTSHPISENRGVVVRHNDVPLHYSKGKHLTISLPMQAVEKDRAKRQAARKTK